MHSGKGPQEYEANRNDLALSRNAGSQPRLARWKMQLYPIRCYHPYRSGPHGRVTNSCLAVTSVRSGRSS